MEWPQLLSSRRFGGDILEAYNDEDVVRNGTYEKGEYEKDYHRIISCASFRRLQDKTQVFPLDRSDFVRTRLTHSLEVSSFARTLGRMVCDPKNKYSISAREPDQAELTRNIPDILMCAGLLHDIGNPPFGHFGETVIGTWFARAMDDPRYAFRGRPLSEHFKADPRMTQDLLHFEGNAQALRLVGKLHFIDSDEGLNLTAAVLNTLVKYPTPSTLIRQDPDNIKYKKMGYFLADEAFFTALARTTGALGEEEDRAAARRHPLTYLLEAADDIAYATADLEDAYKKGLFSFTELAVFLHERYLAYEAQMSPSQQKKTQLLLRRLTALRGEAAKQPPFQKKIESAELYAVQNWMLYVQDWLMYCAVFGFTNHYKPILDGAYHAELLEGTFHQFSMKILKDVMGQFVYPSSQILKLELAAETILSSLLDKFIPAVIHYGDEPEAMTASQKKLVRLISPNYREAYHLAARQYPSQSPEDMAMRLYLRMLLVTDFICGMTDSYAKSLYQELGGIY